MFKEYAYTALTSRFRDRKEFEQFYNSLADSSVNDEFLRVASLYLFLAKQGAWHVKIDGSAEVVDYLSNSFKVVAIFALIESLSDQRHQDFYDWLREKGAFPILDSGALAKLNEEYKASFGSIRRCVQFFSRMPVGRQQALCEAIVVDGKPLGSVQKVAEFLYDIRSKFVHEARLVLQFVEFPVSFALSTKGKKVVETDLPIDTLLDAFEEGVLEYFRHS
jgi:hypothetical protein